MATAVEQTHCDRCQSPLPPGAAYCDVCGERTRKARRLVRLAIRVELLLLLLVVLLVIGFVWVYSAQRP
jgi:predicted nucleic acid-binding Zn ribbon protein